MGDRPKALGDAPAVVQLDGKRWERIDAARAARLRRAEQPDAHAQRLPTPNAHPAIVDLVLARPLSSAARAVIEARDAIGQARYGTRLQPFNGRDVARDLTDEAADAVNYAMQGIAQAQGDAASVRRERRFAMAVGLLEECVGADPEREPGPSDEEIAALILAATDPNRPPGLRLTRDQIGPWIRSLPEPDPAPAYEDDWERANRIAGTTEDLEQLRANLAERQRIIEAHEGTIKFLESEVDRLRADAQPPSWWREQLERILGVTPGSMPNSALVGVVAQRVKPATDVEVRKESVAFHEAETNEVANRYDALAEAIEAHLPEHDGDLLARIASAGADLAQARATIDALNACTAQQAAAINALHSRVAEFGAAIGVPPVEPLDVLIRTAYEVIALQRRVAGLEEERDDANQRVAVKVAGQVRRKAGSPGRTRVTIARKPGRVAVQIKGPGGGSGGIGTRKGGR